MGATEPAGRSARAAFVDRDGVINADSGFVYRIDDWAPLPGAVDGLLHLQRAGFALVVITNQSGIARGLYTEDDYLRLTQHMRRTLAASGVELSAVEHCPHLPDAPLAQYRTDCDCRKPQPGMLRRAAAALGVSLADSILIGDRASDIQAGRGAGVGRCYLVRTGAALSAADIALADGVFDDLAACARQAA